MVYQRDQAIKNFKPEPYFELKVDCKFNPNFWTNLSA
ncbi:hypothetical protein DIS15_13065 [Levilactobacillus brevis]|nr:hypothetical protein [Levilactobacillus brevis]TOY83776.1 hypothetical protein DIS15_13065 [Levilactobacillus brevis]